jgi:hypothetical protein
MISILILQKQYACIIFIYIYLFIYLYLYCSYNPELRTFCVPLCFTERLQRQNQGYSLCECTAVR